MRVSISVGHTPGAPGAVHAGTRLREYDVALRVRNVLLALFEHDRRIEVFPVQPGIALVRRVEIVNRTHRETPFDLAVDLHMNACVDPRPNYAEVYHFATPDGRSSVRGREYGDLFLTALAAEMGTGDGKNDGVSEPFGDEEWERERWGFVRGTAPPALVVEPAFISNDDVARAIIAGGLVTTMAIGCYRGLVACLED